MRLPRLVCAAAALLASVGLAGGPPAAHAQGVLAPVARGFAAAPHLGIGYVANAPDLLRGAGAVYITPRFVGLFVDAKTTGSGPDGRSNFMEEWTAERAQDEFGDFAFGHRDHWLVVNGGLTRVLGPDLAIYAGAGYARRRAFTEFYDESGTRGEYGYYWVEDLVYSDDYVNLLGGVYFRAGSRLLVQFGVEARPRGMTVGVHYALPFGG